MQPKSLQKQSMKWQRKINKWNSIARNKVKILVIIFLMTVIFGLPKFLIPFQSFFLKKEVVRPVPNESWQEQFVNKLLENGIELVERPIFNGEKIEASVSGGTKIFFGPDKDESAQISSLQLLLTRFRIEGRKPIIIDLRFDKPVIRF